MKHIKRLMKKENNTLKGTDRMARKIRGQGTISSEWPMDEPGDKVERTVDGQYCSDDKC